MSIIKKNDLINLYNNNAIANNNNDFDVGMYVMHKNTSYPELLYLYEKNYNDESKQDFFKYHTIDINTLQKIDTEREQRGFNTTSRSQLEEYYNIITIPLEEINKYAERLINGDSLEELNDTNNESALMNLNSKTTLVYLKNETEKAIKIAEQIQSYARNKIEIKKRELQNIIGKFNDKINIMKSEVNKFQYIITTIELYAGIKEDVVQIKSGIPADINEPLVVHQATIFMDEEIALIDDEFDYRKEQHFNDWLITNNNYKTILPEERCIISIKPRRTPKKYSDNDWLNWMMNSPNRRTIFLIRNGENIYKLESDNIDIDDRMFPNKNELEKTIEEENNSKWERDEHSRSTSLRKLYTRVIFLIQGLLDRSETLAPHNIRINLFNDIDLSNQNSIILRYELDNILGDGHKSDKDWIKELNSKLTTGKRIILVNYNFDANYDFLRYYVSKWSAPDFPTAGIYVLENNPLYNESYYKHSKYIIKYLPTDRINNRKWENQYYDEEKRLNRTSIMIHINNSGIINYDDVKLEDIDYYLNSRIYRSQYYEFVKMLKLARKLYLEEKSNEDEFIKMMISILKTACNNELKPQYTYEEIVKIAIDEFKDSLKWKRSILEKSKETFYILKRKILSKNFQNKYFITDKND